MKHTYFLTAVLLFVTSPLLFSQTKFIAHRSHSGSPGTFTLAHPGNMGLGHWEEPIIDTTVSAQAKAVTPHTTPPPTSPVPGVIDTLKVAPGVDSTRPNISNESPKESTSKSTDQARAEATQPDRENRSALLWLALGLGLPTAGILGFNLRQRRSNQT